MCFLSFWMLFFLFVSWMNDIVCESEHFNTHIKAKRLTGLAWQTVISICLERRSAAAHTKKRATPFWKMLTLFVRPASVGVLLIQKTRLPPIKPPWGLCAVVCRCCWVRPLLVFLMAPSRWDRPLLRLAQWPCSTSGPMGARGGLRKPVRAGHRCKTQCRTHADVGLDKIRICRLLQSLVFKSEIEVEHIKVSDWSERLAVCSKCDLYDFIRLSCSCWQSETEAFDLLRVSSLHFEARPSVTSDHCSFLEMKTFSVQCSLPTNSKMKP